MKRQLQVKVSPIAAVLSDVVGGHGHKTQTRQGVELRLFCDCSLEGLGEASPILGFSRDKLEMVRESLEALEPFEIEFPHFPTDCRQRLEECSSRLPEDQPSARFALESALLDLFARYLKISAASLLRSMSPQSNPEVAERITLTRLITETDPVHCLTTVRHAFNRGYRVFKLKLEPGDAFLQTLTNLQSIRDKFGTEVALRLDPNGSFSADNLENSLAALAPFAPELVEEPAYWKEVSTLPLSPVPLAVDESLLDPIALPTLLERRIPLRLEAVVIKPALVGLLRALELAEYARLHHLDVIITHLFDGPVGHATALSFAQAMGSPHRAHGLAPHAGLLMVPTRRIKGLGHGEAWHESEPGLPLLEVKSC